MQTKPNAWFRDLLHHLAEEMNSAYCTAPRHRTTTKLNLI